MPLHLVNTSALSIVNDNARMPSDELLEKSCTYRRKRQSVGPLLPLPKPSKPSRWDAIPVSKKLPDNVMMMPSRTSMSLNDCARMSLRRPARVTEDDKNNDDRSDKLHQPLRCPTRTTGYADAASILELALAEVNFSDDISVTFSDDEQLFSTIQS